MDVNKTISELRERALKNHRSVAAWLKRAGVAPSTYYSWSSPRRSRSRNGAPIQRVSMPSTRTITRLEKAAESA
jgi:hypothetical protein